MKKILLLFFAVLFFFQISNAQETFFQTGHRNDILEVKFSPDKNRLISYSAGDGWIYLWNVADGRVLWRRKTGFIRKANEYATLTSFAFSPDKKFIASGSGNGTIQLWNAETGDFLWRGDAFSDSVTTLDFSPDGESIIVAGSPKKSADEIKILRVRDGQAVKTLDGNPCTVISISFDNGGRILKTGNLDGNVFKWNLESGKQINADTATPCDRKRTYEWETSFSPDLKISAQRTGEKELTVKNTETGETIKKIEASDYRIYSRLSDDGKKLIVSGYGGFTIYDLATGESRKIVESSRTGSTIDLANDGSLFAEGGSYGDASIKITETATGKSRFFSGHPGTIGGISYTPDGKILAVGGSDKTVYLFDAAQKTLLKKLSGHGDPVKELAFNPDGEILVSADDDGVLKVWDWQNGTMVKELKFDNGLNEPQKIEFSKNGRYFLIIVNGSLAIYNVNDWSLLKEIKTKEGYESKSGSMTIGYSSVPISSGAFAENGAKVITTHADGTLRIWKTISGKEIKKLKVGESAPLMLIAGEQRAVVPIGKWDEQKLKLIDLKTGKILRTFYEEFESKFEAITVSPNGKNFITGNSAGEIALWKLDEEKFIREFDIGYSGDDSVAFSPDGKTFTVGGDNQNLYTFNVETGEKLWQLIPFYQPSELEIELEARGKKGRAEVEARKAERDKQAEKEVPALAKKITVKFSHYGTAESFWDQKIAESGVPNKSKLKLPKEKATVAWFAFTNDSDLPVSIDTNSMYFNPKCKGLCNGAEIS
ncbi:MAG TPA: WD40 repeat domain-containing protein [Pyrinomonadaceae bacterium]|jgi:WD40 repeat protein